MGKDGENLSDYGNYYGKLLKEGVELRGELLMYSNNLDKIIEIQLMIL